VSETERPSSELARVPRQVVLPGDAADRSRQDEDEPADDGRSVDRDSPHDGEPGSDWARLRSWLQDHPVTAACLALIIASLVWKAVFLSHYYFHDDDFEVFDVALRSKFSWSFLTHDYVGHLFPGVYAVAWVLARTALYSWVAASAETLVMVAAASLAAWRLLRTLLGNRPAILIPLSIYLLSPIAFPLYSWWINAVEAIPLQIAVFMCLDSHVRYVWTGKFRHAAAAAGWLVFGLLFFEKSALIPLLLFAVTAGFLTRRSLLPSIWITLTRLWRAWVLYVVLLAGYAALLVGAMAAAKTPSSVGSVHQDATFASELLRDSFLPSIFGGPWRWFISGVNAPVSAPPSALATAALLATLVIIVASILVRRRAWRAWAILAGWIILDDVLPVALGRLGFPTADVLLGLATRYITDATAILAIAVALAFWPLAGPQDQTDSNSARREFFTGRWQAVALGFTAVLVIGSLWSVTDLQDTSNGSYARSYISVARTAIADAPSGTVIAGGLQVPGPVMNPTFGRNSDVSAVLEPLSHRGALLSWPAQPEGTIDSLMVFGQSGQLYPAQVIGTTSNPLPLKDSCTSRTTGSFTLHFPVRTSVFTVILRIPYLSDAPAAGRQITVMYGSTVRQIDIQRGAHNAYVPVTGSAWTVTFQSSPSVLFCPGAVTAGQLDVPALGSPGGIPASPAAG
jgi:hypothetical protein